MSRSVTPEPLIDAIGMPPMAAVLAEKEPLAERHGVVVQFLLLCRGDNAGAADAAVVPDPRPHASPRPAPSAAAAPTIRGRQHLVGADPLLRHDPVQLQVRVDHSLRKERLKKESNT